MWQKIKPYVISCIISLGVGGLSAKLSRNGIMEFNSAAKPPLTPPMWVFPVVWTILFTLMGVSSANVWVKNGNKFDTSLKVYAAQLAVNFLWPLVFFNLSAYLTAFCIIIILACLILYMIILFNRTSKTAALLQIPYLVWVLFASYLNFGVFLLNR